MGGEGSATLSPWLVACQLLAIVLRVMFLSACSHQTVLASLKNNEISRGA